MTERKFLRDHACQMENLRENYKSNLFLQKVYHMYPFNRQGLEDCRIEGQASQVYAKS